MKKSIIAIIIVNAILTLLSAFCLGALVMCRDLAGSSWSWCFEETAGFTVAGIGLIVGSICLVMQLHKIREITAFHPHD